jgi:hypothetical protein
MKKGLKNIDQELAEVKALVERRRDELVGVALICERLLNIDDIKAVHAFCRQALNTLDEYRPKGRH